MIDLTLCVPFYKNQRMLERQVNEWNLYTSLINIVVIDDGSPDPARPIIEAAASVDLLRRIRLFRIDVDIPWNRGGARNLGAHVAETDWILHCDIDHVLPAECAGRLVVFQREPGVMYRFPRYRVGRADETRKKDAIPPDQAFGKIKPHGDSYLCTRDLYWRAGGYNEDFSGCLGGGSPFLKLLEEEAAAVEVLPDDIHLHVHTRHVIDDASDLTLSRDTTEYQRRKAAMRGDYRGSNPLRFPWARVL